MRAFLLPLVFCISPLAAASSCPASEDMSRADLIGTWQAQIDGHPATVVHIGPHPESSGSVRGHLERAGRRIEIAGDVGDGELTLEESENGSTISAAWLGDVVEGSCAREIRGAWKAEGAAAERGFVLKKR